MPRPLAKLLAKQQRMICYICKEVMVFEVNQPNSATVDHIVPKFEADPIFYASKHNKKAACWKCNNKKGQEEDQRKKEYDAIIRFLNGSAFPNGNKSFDGMEGS